MKTFGGSSFEAKQPSVPNELEGIDKKLVTQAVTPNFKAEFGTLARDRQLICLKHLTIWAKKHPGEKLDSLKGLRLPPPTPPEALKSRKTKEYKAPAVKQVTVEFEVGGPQGQKVVSIVMTEQVLTEYDHMAGYPALQKQIFDRMAGIMRADPKAVITKLPMQTQDMVVLGRENKQTTVMRAASGIGLRADATRGKKSSPSDEAPTEIFDPTTIFTDAETAQLEQARRAYDETLAKRPVRREKGADKA